MDLTGRLTLAARFFKVQENPDLGVMLLYLSIVILSVIVYKLGFARKLPVIKTVIVYIFLILGCSILTLLGLFMPIAEGLAVAVIVLLIYKLRRRQKKTVNREM